MKLIKRSKGDSGMHVNYSPDLGDISNIQYYDWLANNEHAKQRAFKAYLNIIESYFLVDGIYWQFYEEFNRLKVIVSSKCFDLEKQRNTVERRIVADYGYEFDFYIKVKSLPIQDAYIERRDNQIVLQLVQRGIMLSFTPNSELLKKTAPGESLHYSWEGQTSQVYYGVSIKRPWSRKDVIMMKK